MRLSLILFVLLLAGCSAQQKRELLIITVRGSNTFELAGKVMDRSQLGDTLQELDESVYGYNTDIQIVATPSTPFEWIHCVRLTAVRTPRSGDFYLTTNTSERGQYFSDGCIGDSSTIWKSTEVNLEKGEFYLYLDEGRVARLDDPKTFWANTNYAHMAYIVASPTTTAQRLIQELDTLNACKVLPYILDFNIFSGDAIVEEFDQSKL